MECDAMTTEREERALPHDYRSAGVDIDAASRAKGRLGELAASTFGPLVRGGVGHFGGMFHVPSPGSRDTLVASIDSVGTKVLVAALAGRHRGIGKDIVHHAVNDILAVGARPLFFLDYFAQPALDTVVLEAVIEGIADACRASGCALIGGETAQLPGIYQPGTYDLAGCIVGIVPDDRLIDGRAVRAGDCVIGLPSAGLHTNGYSLARAVLGLDGDVNAARQRLKERIGPDSTELEDLLLEPHRSYLADVTRVLDTDPEAMHGRAHITGGGIIDNVARVVPDGLTAMIDVGWEVPTIFQHIQATGDINALEMYRVFNMGIGFVLIVDPASTESAIAAIPAAQRIGVIERAATAERVRLIGLEDE